MDLLRARFLWYPLAVLLAIIVVDKVFLLDAVKEHTVLWKKIEPLFYESRVDLFAQLRTEYGTRAARGEHLGLVFGSSRGGEFNAEEFTRARPGAFTYNFSAPLAPPSYFYYWLDRILSAGMRPGFAVVECDPLLFSQQAAGYSLAYGYDAAFMLRHTDFFRDTRRDFRAEGAGFSVDESETFFLKRLFALYRYPLEWKTIEENNEEHSAIVPGTGLITIRGRDFKKNLREIVLDANRRNLGGIPNPLSFSLPEDEIAKDADRMEQLHLKSGFPAPTQVIFFKKLITRLALEKIPVVVYWPLSAPALRAKYQANGLFESFQAPVREFLAETARENPDVSIAFLDPYDDESLTCRVFIDSSHLSGACFPAITARLASRLPAR